MIGDLLMYFDERMGVEWQILWGELECLSAAGAARKKDDSLIYYIRVRPGTYDGTAGSKLKARSAIFLAKLASQWQMGTAARRIINSQGCGENFESHRVENRNATKKAGESLFLPCKAS